MTVLVRFALLIIFTVCVVLTGGCAAEGEDDSQPIAFSSVPEGASVYLNGVEVGRTPVVVPVNRNVEHQRVTFGMEEYQTVEIRNETSNFGVADDFFGNQKLRIHARLIPDKTNAPNSRVIYYLP